MGRELVRVELRYRGTKILDFNTQADPKDPDDLQKVVEEAVARDGRTDKPISDFEIKVFKQNGSHLITYVGRSRP